MTDPSDNTPSAWIATHTEHLIDVGAGPHLVRLSSYYDPETNTSIAMELPVECRVYKPWEPPVPIIPNEVRPLAKGLVSIMAMMAVKGAAVKRFAIYARFSSDQQNAASIEDQVRVCRAYVERAGGIALATYADAAVSGANTSARPRYQALLRDAEAGVFDCILAEDIDRYARDTEESAWLLKRMSFRNIEVHTVHGKVGKLLGGIKAVIADYHNDQLAEKTKHGMVGAFERGGIPNGLCYGYRAGAAPHD